jgi:hypothetical protein
VISKLIKPIQFSRFVTKPVRFDFENQSIFDKNETSYYSKNDFRLVSSVYRPIFAVLKTGTIPIFESLTTSPQILLTSSPGHRIWHARGLRQGDPLSPLLFILVMEDLSGLFLVASERNLFTPLRIPSLRYKISLYADDVVVFIVPSEQDIRLVK